MYCQNCGAQLDKNNLCPNCSAPHAQPPVQNYYAPEQKKGPSKGARTYAALVSAAMVFPASLCMAIDMSFHSYDYWFGFVVGAVLVAWVCLVLPALKITPPPVTAIICFVTMMGYVFYIMYKFSYMEWLFQRALPLTVLFIVFVSIDILIVSYKKVNWLSALSVMNFETAFYLMAIEATYKGGFDRLRWSPILACAFISVAAVLLAFAYIGNLHKKDK